MRRNFEFLRLGHQVINWRNEALETNRRPASPLNAWREFRRAVSARRSLSAAVAQLDHLTQNHLPISDKHS